MHTRLTLTGLSGSFLLRSRMALLVLILQTSRGPAVQRKQSTAYDTHIDVTRWCGSTGKRIWIEFNGRTAYYAPFTANTV